MVCTIINSSGTTTDEPQANRRVVQLQSFEHFDAISMVSKSTDDGKLLSICFLQ